MKNIIIGVYGSFLLAIAFAFSNAPKSPVALAASCDTACCETPAECGPGDTDCICPFECKQ